MTEEELQQTRKDLKIQALLETNSNLNNELSDYKVELRLYQSVLEENKQRIAELEGQLLATPEDAGSDQAD